MAMDAKRFQFFGSGIVVLFFAVSFFGSILRAQPNQTEQGSGAPSPSFEVASVKQAPADETGGYTYSFEPGGRTVIRGFALKYLILLAWHIPEFQLQGISPWMEKVLYDIEAEAAGDPTHDQSLLMLQSLLTDRFHLVAHHETKELLIFVLRRKGSLGSDLTPTKDGSCTPTAEIRVVPPAPLGATPLCGLEVRLIQLQDGGGPAMLMNWRGTPMSFVTRTLGTTLYRHVTDETELSGNYDVQLEYRPENFSGKSTPIPGAADSAAPSIFTAVQEQLGLKLDSEKGPVDVLVIDHVERPSEN